MKRPENFLGLRTFVCATAIVLMSTSCAHSPRKLPPASGTAGEESDKNYVASYINSPEMFSRERLQAERTLELRLSWAMKKATEDGNVRVRAIAPPLQLTGDPNIDFGVTHNVMLVADDLKSEQKFENVYEVRVGPSPELATVRPARASDSLANADQILAEEQLTKIRLDEQTLKADLKFAKTIGPRLTNHVAAASNLTAEIRARVESQSKELQSRLVTTNTFVTELESNFAKAQMKFAEAQTKLSRATDDAQIKPAKAEVETAESILSTNRSYLIAARSAASSIEFQINKLNTQKADLADREESLRLKLATFSRNSDAVEASKDALTELKGFWEKMVRGVEGLTNYTAYTTVANPYPMPSAMVVSFRAQALQALQQVTIDVVRKSEKGTNVAPVTSEKTDSAGSAAARALSVALEKVTEAIQPLKGLLMAEKNAVEDKSRRAHLKVNGDKVQEAAGELEAQVVLFQKSVAGSPVLQIKQEDNRGNLVQGGRNPAGAAPTQALLARLESYQSLDNKLASSTNLQLAAGPNFTDVTNRLTRSRESLQRMQHLADNPPTMGTNLMESVTNTLAQLTDASSNLAQIAKDIPALHQSLTNLLLEADSLASKGTNQAIKIEKMKLQTWIGEVSAASDAVVAVQAGQSQIEATSDRLQQLPGAISAEQFIREALNKGLEAVSNHLASLTAKFAVNSVGSADWRRQTATNVTELRRSIAKAVRLASGLSEQSRIVAALVSGKTPPEEKKMSGDDVVAQILRGDQAVFRLNVLHGVVSTTAFLLADDGAAQLFGQAFADQFYAAQVTFRNPNDKPILIYGNTMRLIVRMNAANPGPFAEDGQPERATWWATWEPLDYDAIRRMVEGQQEHSWQRYLSKTLDLAALGLGVYGVAYDGGKDFLRFIGAFNGSVPQLKNMLEADLKRHALNFREKGLNSIEEIGPQSPLTRYVFLPKGPIFGTYAHDKAEANDLPFSSAEGHWNPFQPESRDFGKRALQAAYIHDIRREEVYVEGKRILASDPLTPAGR